MKINGKHRVLRRVRIESSHAMSTNFGLKMEKSCR